MAGHQRAEALRSTSQERIGAAQGSYHDYPLQGEDRGRPRSGLEREIAGRRFVAEPEGRIIVQHGASVPDGYGQRQIGLEDRTRHLLLDAGPDASVYLGLKDGVDPERALRDLRQAQVATGYLATFL